MIGKNATSWSWLNSIGIPALLVIAEATWVSLLIDATVDTTKGAHPDVPFLAIAVSAVAAVAVAGGLGRIAWNWWRRVLVLIPIVVVGVSVSAATLGVLTSGSGSWWSMATKPWSVGGHTAATVSGRGLVRGCVGMGKRRLGGSGFTVLSGHGVVSWLGCGRVHGDLPRPSRPACRGIQCGYGWRRLAVVPLVPSCPPPWLPWYGSET